jgi:prevent-host-death family protein
MEISVKEARRKFSLLLNQVQGGDEVVILRRGKEAARLVPPKGVTKCLPSLKDFRKSIRITGRPLSKTVVAQRSKGRY